MAGEKQSTEAERQHLARRLRALKGSGSWSDVAERLNAHASTKAEWIQQESIRKAAEHVSGGLKDLRLVERLDAAGAQGGASSMSAMSITSVCSPMRPSGSGARLTQDKKNAAKSQVGSTGCNYFGPHLQLALATCANRS